jgi:hypothetical protein
MTGRPRRPSYAGGRPGLCSTKVLATRPEAPFPLTQLPVSQCSGSGSSIFASRPIRIKALSSQKESFLHFPRLFFQMSTFNLPKKISKFTYARSRFKKNSYAFTKESLKNNLSKLIALSGSRKAICGSGKETLPVFVWFSARLARRDIYM